MKNAQELQDALLKMGYYATIDYASSKLYKFSKDSPKGAIYDRVVTSFSYYPDPNCCGHTCLAGFPMVGNYPKENDVAAAMDIFYHVIKFLPAAPFRTWTLAAEAQKPMIERSKAIGAKLLHEWRGVHFSGVLMFGIEKVGAGVSLLRPSPEVLAKYLK